MTHPWFLCFIVRLANTFVLLIFPCKADLFACVLRCLVVYPWTQRYFGNFGNLYNAAAIMGNPLVAKHGTTILHGLDRAVKNMDSIKDEYAELSVLHSEKLHVDPDNFKVSLVELMSPCHPQ